MLAAGDPVSPLVSNVPAGKVPVKSELLNVEANILAAGAPVSPLVSNVPAGKVPVKSELLNVYANILAAGDPVIGGKGLSASVITVEFCLKKLL